MTTTRLSPESLEMMRENAGEAARLMKALANDSRLMILCYLDGKELSVSELNENLDPSQHFHNTLQCFVEMA